MNTSKIQFFSSSSRTQPSPSSSSSSSSSSLRNATNVLSSRHPPMSTSLISNCRVGEVATQSPVDPGYFKEFKAPSQPRDIPAWEMGLKIALYLLAFLLAVCGNSLVIFVICRTRRMRSTTNVLLLNLALSDLTVAAVCMWVHLGNAITPEWPFGGWVCKVNTFCQVAAVMSSVLTLTAISVERFVAILFPLRGGWSGRTTATIVALTWLVALAVASPHLVVRQVLESRWKDRHEVWCAEVWPRVYRDAVTCDTWQPGKMVYYSIEGIVMYVLPVLIMTVTYALITHRLITRCSPGILTSATAAAQERAKRKVIKMLVAVVVCFVVCWSPQQYLLLRSVFKPYLGFSADQASDYHTLKYTALYVAYLNSALNPILYCGFNHNFRHSFKEALWRCVVAKRSNAVHPVAACRDQKKEERVGGDRDSIDNNGCCSSSSLPGASTASSTHDLRQHHAEVKRPSTKNTSTLADDGIEDILGDASLPSPITSTCRRRSVQPEDCGLTRPA